MNAQTNLEDKNCLIWRKSIVGFDDISEESREEGYSSYIYMFTSLCLLSLKRHISMRLLCIFMRR